MNLYDLTEDEKSLKIKAESIGWTQIIKGNLPCKHDNRFPSNEYGLLGLPPNEKDISGFGHCDHYLTPLRDKFK